MFEGITRSLGDAFKKLRGRGRLTPENIRDGLREVRRAFLEADVNFNVLTDFVGRAKFDAWADLKGQSLEQAKQTYIDLIAELNK